MISYALAAWFDRQGHSYLADICATVGSVVFGAAIALTGQMYHLSGDFSACVLLWAGGALLAAALTGSRGALAVELVTGCVWSGMLVIDSNDVPHLSFILFWMITAAMAVVWNAPSGTRFTFMFISVSPAPSIGVAPAATIVSGSRLKNVTRLDAVKIHQVSAASATR